MSRRTLTNLLAIAAVIVGASLLLDGCQRPGLKQAAGMPAAPSAANLAVETGQLRAASGCDYGYTLYRDAAADAPVQIVLAHGFLRDRQRMDALARALAVAGMTTVTLDLCNMRPWDGGHRQNALEMRRVATQLAAMRPLYVGFSAGGLAAILASAADSDAAGALTLDLVDQAGMGRRAAATLLQPVIGLFGEASRCNAQLNGVVVIEAAPRGELHRVDGATHCDFESPSDGLCRLVCEPAGRSPDKAAERRALIIEQTVSAARQLLSAAERQAVVP